MSQLLIEEVVRDRASDKLYLLPASASVGDAVELMAEHEIGAVANDHVKELADINGREFLMLSLLAAAVLWMGVYPKPFTDVMQVSVSELLKHVAVSKLN